MEYDIQYYLTDFEKKKPMVFCYGCLGRMRVIDGFFICQNILCDRRGLVAFHGKVIQKTTKYPDGTIINRGLEYDKDS